MIEKLVHFHLLSPIIIENWTMEQKKLAIIDFLVLAMDKLKLTGRALGPVFNFRSGCMHTMHLLPSVAIQPNLELKTRAKQLQGSLLLVMALPVLA
jgi:hypothetical protein